MDFKQTLRWAIERGHNWTDPNCYELTPDDAETLQPDDPRAVAILRSFSQMFMTEYAPACAKAHKRSPDFDGEFGPAFQATVDALESDEVQVCGCPDLTPPPGVILDQSDPDVREVAATWNASLPPEAKWGRSEMLPAQGRGNWRGCHDVGNFHAVLVDWDLRNITSHWRNALPDALAGVQNCDAELGLWNWFRDAATGKDLITGEDLRDMGRAQIGASLVTRSPGWIGLAQVISNPGCSWWEWCRYLVTWAAPMIDISTLIKHELGHNKRWGHQPGPFNTMNPTIRRNLPLNSYSTRDRLRASLILDYGGEPFPTDQPPGPGPQPPPNTVEARLDALESAQFQDDIEQLVMMTLLGELRQDVDGLLGSGG